MPQVLHFIAHITTLKSNQIFKSRKQLRQSFSQKLLRKPGKPRLHKINKYFYYQSLLTFRIFFKNRKLMLIKNVSHYLTKLLKINKQIQIVRAYQLMPKFYSVYLRILLLQLFKQKIKLVIIFTTKLYLPKCIHEIFQIYIVFQTKRQPFYQIHNVFFTTIFQQKVNTLKNLPRYPNLRNLNTFFAALLIRQKHRFPKKLQLFYLIYLQA